MGDKEFRAAIPNETSAPSIIVIEELREMIAVLAEENEKLREIADHVSFQIFQLREAIN